MPIIYFVTQIAIGKRSVTFQHESCRRLKYNVTHWLRSHNGSRLGVNITIKRMAGDYCLDEFKFVGGNSRWVAI